MRTRLAVLSPALLALAACGWPHRAATIVVQGQLLPLQDFEGVRAVDGYPSPHYQRSFNAAIADFARSEAPGEDGRRDYDMLVLSSGGVNGAFGAGVLTGWTQRGDRPDFWLVTGVSVGALIAPFAFAGPEFDHRLEELFARIRPSDMHREKGIVASVLWDESLMDNTALRRSIERGVDMELLRAVAARHAEGRRCFVGSTNLDLGHFVVWDLGEIATVGTPRALDLFRKVLSASAAIPVIYPPVRFEHGERDELHVDGAVIRPLFMPQNVFDCHEAGELAGIDWSEVDSTMYVIHNGSLRPCPVDVQRDTLDIATRTVTMMSYTMINEHVLHLFMLCRAWEAEFRFVTLPDGLELGVDSFTPQDTFRLWLLGQGTMERRVPWDDAPPGYLLRRDLERIAPAGHGRSTAGDEVLERLQRVENELRALRRK